MAKEFTIIYGGTDPQGFACDVSIKAASVRDAAYRYIMSKNPDLALTPDYNMIPVLGPSGKERWVRVPNPDMTGIPLGIRVGEKTANKAYAHF